MAASSRQTSSLFFLFSAKKQNAKSKCQAQALHPNLVSKQFLIYSGLHILFLKCEGIKFPRNAYANQLEVYCSTYFYGPLVIVFGDTNPPYRLHDFPPSYLIEKIDPLNEANQRYYPLPFTAKKCSLVRQLMNERRFTLELDKLKGDLTNEQFMLYCYKTSFCPLMNQKHHEWSECNYAHRQQDFRRPPYSFYYYPERCQNISEDGSWEACGDYLNCEYSHTLIETLFNPLHFKIRECPDKIAGQKMSCQKVGVLCSHYHSQEERELALKTLSDGVPKQLPANEGMDWYEEIMPEYISAAQASA